MPALGRLRGKPSAPQEEVNADQQRGEVEVVVISASNLAAKDSNGSSDPYVRITCIEPTRSRKKTTTQKRMNLNPTWNERFFFADVAGNGRIVFDVFDADENGSDDLIGKVTIPLERLARNELSEANYEMIDGDIRLAVAFRPGKTGSTKGDVIDASLTPALLPGGPDGPQVVGRPFSDVQHDSDELLSEIRAIAEQLQRSAGRLFEDEDFAGPRSLFIEPKRVPDDFLDGGRKEVVMMRPREINPKMARARVRASERARAATRDRATGAVARAQQCMPPARMRTRCSSTRSRATCARSSRTISTRARLATATCSRRSRRSRRRSGSSRT